MFKEIETQLLSIISDESIEKIIHRPSNEIAKSMELLYDIKFDDIERTYKEEHDCYNLITVVYTAEKDNITIGSCYINGKMNIFIFFPKHLLNKSESNAVTFMKSIKRYVDIRIKIITDEYENLYKINPESMAVATLFQAVTILTCSIIRKVYSGASLAKTIYNSIEVQKYYTEEGISSILNLFDEGLGVEELLDNSFICAIQKDNKKYPGIWQKAES